MLHFLTSEHRRGFSEVSATFTYNALKMDTYTYIWTMVHFSPIKTPKTLQISEAFVC